MFKRAIASVLTAAASALVLPFAFADVAKCDDPLHTFVMSGPGGSTVADTTDAKKQFCTALTTVTALYR